MSLFGSLYIGTSGLQTSQNALNTTAHNMSNAATGGYTRQQVYQVDRNYTTLSNNSKAVSKKQTGLGVNYAQTRQVRDYFLDRTYREEYGRMCFYQTSYNAFTQVEDLMGELYGESFNQSLSNLSEAINELAKEPANPVKQGLLVNRASQFLQRSSAIYRDLCDMQDKMNKQVKDNVDRINDIAQRIFDLNTEIVKIEIGGIEHANDLRDERNALLDELAGIIHINFSEDYDGAVIVKAEGHQLVTRGLVFEMGVFQDPNTNFYTPYWVLDATVDPKTGNPDLSNSMVFDLTLPISTARDSDIGTLKAQLLARGDHRANYLDMQTDADTYNSTIANSVIMNTMAEFDNLVHLIATKLNEAFASAADKDNGYLVDKNGNPIQLFQRISLPGYDESGNPIPEDSRPGHENTLYTVLNMTINPDLMKEPTLLGMVNAEDKEDYPLGKLLQGVLYEEIYYLNPNVTNPCNLIDMYSNIVSQLTISAAVFRDVYEDQTTLTNSTEYMRQQVVGVSDDEELNNMIKFQNAFNASSRYINVIDEMMEHIINTLGT